MITVTVTLPPDTSPDIVDVISVSVLYDGRDRQPRGTYLEGFTTRTRSFDTDLHHLTHHSTRLKNPQEIT